MQNATSEKMKDGSMNQDKGEKTLPLHFWLGLGLAILFWFLNWNLQGLRTHWGFFPLWLGYALTVDGLTFYRKGDSLLCRNPLAYLGLFLVSVPGWWLFELVNLRTQNWYYLGRDAFSDLEYALLSSISFSTVMPAVFGTADRLIASLEELRQTRVLQVWIGGVRVDARGE